MYEGRLRQEVLHCELAQLSQPDPPAHRGGAQVFVLRQGVRPAVSPQDPHQHAHRAQTLQVRL